MPPAPRVHVVADPVYVGNRMNLYPTTVVYAKRDGDVTARLNGMLHRFPGRSSDRMGVPRSIMNGEWSPEEPAFR